jgi:hypothetical protein
MLKYLCICLVFSISLSMQASAQEARADAQDKDDLRKLPISKDQLDQAREVMETTKAMGWDRQYQFIDQATDQMFVQQGWNSEPDQFSRNVLREVGQIPPWQPRQREEAFMNAVQTRLSLSQDQRSMLNKDMQREGMMLAVRHFKEVLPVALEVAKTRAADEPFTAEQVQRWSSALQPIMDESLQTVERVSKKLEKTMTEEQRKKLRADMDALVKRHHDVEKLMVKWQKGEWSPKDWGLQNDPVHAAAMAQIAAGEQSGIGPDGKPLVDDSRVGQNENEWDKYVKQFCEKYECDAAQRTKADAILKSSKREAIAYRDSRREIVKQYEAIMKSPTESAARKAEAATELSKDLAPIGAIFKRMKDRLYADILTTQQRMKFPPEK